MVFTLLQCPTGIFIGGTSLEFIDNRRSWAPRSRRGWFNNICDGTYIELGGLDGVRFSNSHAFNKGLGWKGVLIELDDENYKRSVVNRPNEIANINAGVCSVPQALHAVTSGSVSNAIGGIW